MIFFILPLPDVSRHEHIGSSADAATGGVQNGIPDKIQNFPAFIRQADLFAENIVPTDSCYLLAEFGMHKFLGIGVGLQNKSFFRIRNYMKMIE